MAFRGITRIIAIVGIASTFLVQSDSLWSEEGSGDNGGVTSPSLSSMVPANLFSPEAAGRMAQSMTQCFNATPELNQIGNSLSSRSGKPINCNGPLMDNDVETELPQCEDAQVEGKFSAAKFDAMVEKLQNAEDQFICKKAKFDRLNADLACMQSMASTLQAQAASLQRDFQQNLQKMQQDVQSVKAMERDREMQMKDVMDKLGDDKEGTGKDGLVNLGKLTEAMLSEALPREVQEAKEKVNQLEMQKKFHEESVVARKLTLTQSCFNTRTSPSFKCAKNGKPVSAREYALCRFEQNQTLTDGGQIQQTQLATKRASAQKDSLDSVLSAIFGDSAVNVPVPDSKNPQTAPPLRQVSIFSIDDIEKQYGAKLRAFDGKGLGIHAFVMSAMKNCYSTANKSVASELKSAASEVGRGVNALKVFESQVISESNRKLEKYATHYGKLMNALTGQSMPLNTQACKAGNPRIQINCLEDTRRNMEGLYHGNVPQSQMRILVKGTIDAQTININCRGITGCISALQNTMTGLKRERQRLDQFKKDYVLRANQNVEMFAKNMADRLSPQSQMIAQRIAQMNQMLAQMGMQPLQTDDMKPEQIQHDKDMEGLAKMPGNVVALISGKMNPPMLDMSGRGLNSSRSQIAREQQELGRKTDAIKKTLSKVSAKKKSCLKEELASEFEVLKGQNDFASKCVSQTNCEDQALNEAVGGMLDSYSEMGEFFARYGVKVVASVNETKGFLGGFGDACKALKRAYTTTSELTEGGKTYASLDGMQKIKFDQASTIINKYSGEREAAECKAIVQTMKTKSDVIKDTYKEAGDSSAKEAK